MRDDEYTPSLAEVKVAYRLSELGLVRDPDETPTARDKAEVDAEFDRWLAETIRQAKAEAWGVGRAMGLSDYARSRMAGRSIRTPSPYAEEAPDA